MNDKAMATKIPEPPPSGYVARIRRWFDEEHEERKLEDRCRGFGWAMSEFLVRKKGVGVLYAHWAKAEKDNIILPFDMGVKAAIDEIQRVTILEHTNEMLRRESEHE